ncbi:hypothetical protein MPH_03992 [Macrophomina phaseolina MS6]|uniref:Uncharacterized protein n=1 Tax=Macrophomina phaseolina (strain MS6) TaxID=1126212 RepID=K2R8M2_MACPH|nr:hypothetical protein MPH_03992 [Macrophomina phaseolina MS6]
MYIEPSEPHLPCVCDASRAERRDSPNSILFLAYLLNGFRSLTTSWGQSTCPLTILSSPPWSGFSTLTWIEVRSLTFSSMLLCPRYPVGLLICLWQRYATSSGRIVHLPPSMPATLSSWTTLRLPTCCRSPTNRRSLTISAH